MAPDSFWSIYAAPFFTALSTGIILFVINRMFNKRDIKDEEIVKLTKEKETLRELMMKQTHDKLSDTLCQVKSAVDRIERSLSNKVDKTDCIRESQDQWEAINNLREKIKHG